MTCDPWQAEAASIARDIAATLALERERTERLMLALESINERVEAMRAALDRSALSVNTMKREHPVGVTSGAAREA